MKILTAKFAGFGTRFNHHFLESRTLTATQYATTYAPVRAHLVNTVLWRETETDLFNDNDADNDNNYKDIVNDDDDDIDINTVTMKMIMVTVTLL